MKCSSCGKEIPLTGNVCPYCQANKEGDRTSHVLAMTGGVGGALAGVYLFGFWGAVGGMLAGVIGGMVLGRKMAKDSAKH